MAFTMKDEFQFVAVRYLVEHHSVWRVPADWDKEQIKIKWDKVMYQGKKSTLPIKVQDCEDIRDDEIFKEPSDFIVGSAEEIGDDNFYPNYWKNGKPNVEDKDEGTPKRKQIRQMRIDAGDGDEADDEWEDKSEHDEDCDSDGECLCGGQKYGTDEESDDEESDDE